VSVLSPLATELEIVSTAARTRGRLLLKNLGPTAESESVRVRTTTTLLSLAAMALASCDGGGGTAAPASPARPAEPAALTRAPEPGSLGRAIRVGGPLDETAPPTLAVQNGRLWSLGAGKLREIDTRTEHARPVAATLPPYATTLQPGLGVLWATENGRVLRIEGSKVRRSRLIQASSRALAASDTGVWVVTPTPDGSKVSRLDPATLRRTASVRLGLHAYQLAAAGGRVWALDQDRQELVALGGPKGQVEVNERLPGFPVQVLAAGGWVWVTIRDPHGFSRETVLRFDPRSGRSDGPPLHPNTGARAIAAEGDRVWTAGPKWLRTFDMDTGKQLGHAVRIGPQPVDLERLNGRLWLADAAEHSVRRVSPSLPAR
jgi:hypothetical protein